MALRYGERRQQILFPPSIEDSVAQDDPVRVYDAFVEALDWSIVGIDSNPKKAGCPQYDPKTMLKILLYAYSYGGVRSSRKLERALHHNITFIWLAGGLKPDHKTIARYRRKNKKAFKKVLKQCVQLCIKLKVIAGHTLFVDGTKIRANAGINRTQTPDRCREMLEKIDHRIDKLLSECEQIDQRENGQGSLVKLHKDLADQETLKSKIQATLEVMEKEGLERLNTTDPDCVRIHGRQGSHAGYNGQIVVDEAHGLIVHSDVVNENNDLQQFANQVEQSHQNLGSPCKNACADAGFYNGDELEKIDQQGINVIVPTNQQASGKSPEAFDKSNFRFCPEEDCYVCPAGKTLKRYAYDQGKKSVRYIAGGPVCMACIHFGICTQSRRVGRTLNRCDNEEFRERLKQQYEQPSSQAIFSRRKETVELPFGHIKRNLGVESFLLRGLEHVRGEMSILSTCFNVTRLIGLLGVSALLVKLGSL